MRRKTPQINDVTCSVALCIAGWKGALRYEYKSDQNFLHALSLSLSHSSLISVSLSVVHLQLLRFYTFLSIDLLIHERVATLPYPATVPIGAWSSWGGLGARTLGHGEAH